MPPLEGPKRTRAIHWLLLAAIAAVGAWLLYANPPVTWVLSGFTLLLAVGAYFGHRWSKRMREERAHESICTFARALPARHHDTTVVRAVYEEFERTLRIPVRPSDDLAKDLRLHPDDRDDIALKVARRAGRSLAEPERNPLFDRVKTVADVISFLEHQPKSANQPSDPTRFARGSS